MIMNSETTNINIDLDASSSSPLVRTGEYLENHRLLEDEIQILKESEAKLKQQYADSQRRERILARRLAIKEQEMQDYANQISELKTAQAPGPAALRSALLDPAVNILFQKLKAELQSTKAKLEETQNELSAWKFTPDSNTGKRLMAKCRLLYQENEELGKMTSNGRLAKLEGELALQKSYNEEIKKSQLELDDFLQELDEDVEGMQSTIVFLQQELKLAKDTIQDMEKEIMQLKVLSPLNGNDEGDGDGDDNSKLVINGNNKVNKCSSDDLLVNRTELRTTSTINGGEEQNNCSNINKNSNSLNSNGKKINTRSNSHLNNTTTTTANSRKRNYNDEENDNADNEYDVDMEKDDKNDNNSENIISEQADNDQCVVTPNKRTAKTVKNAKNQMKTMNNNKKMKIIASTADDDEEDNGIDMTNGGN